MARTRCRHALVPLLSAGLLIGSSLVAVEAQPAPPPGPRACFGAGPGRYADLRAADQHFIAMMIPHHDGAIAMADLALLRAQRPEIRDLARQIKATQSAENAQMRRWYRQWFGAAVPAWTTCPMGMGPGMGMALPGMGASIDALNTARDVDRAFLEQMIPHHRIGVMMASHAQWMTGHPELRQLEATMVRVQSRELLQMEQWYRQWYGASGP